MKKVVSLHIRSESGDEYDLIFTDKSAKQIKRSLWNNVCYYGADIKYKSEGLSGKEITDLELALHEVEAESWEWE